MQAPSGQVHAAAVDLGSNSFHMVIATWEDGVLKVVDRLRERVLLASALDQQGCLDPEAVARAMATLARFRQRINELPHPRVRAVGTDTFRVAKEPADFHAQAEAALGQRISVLAGAEEARLIYRGIRYDIGRQGEEILAVDIGGGSTELMSGRGPLPEVAESLHLGSASWTRRYFPEGRISRKAMRDAILTAERRIERYQRSLPNPDQSLCLGSSGTVLSLARILQEAGWASEGSFSQQALERLRQDIEKEDHLEDIQLDGLSRGRRPTFLGGLCILIGVMRALDIETMHTTEAALREGLLLDLLGRLQGPGADLRMSTVDHLQQRYRIDVAQAQRVEKTAASLSKAVMESWDFDLEAQQQLAWAAALHEIGLFIRHQGFHRHGAWLLGHADLPGFSTGEAARLAFLVRQQRHGFATRSLEDFSADDRPALEQQVLLLRLATLLHRGRAPESLPLRFHAPKEGQLQIHAPDGWWQEHPLTRLDLEEEQQLWKQHGYRLLCAREDD